MSFSQDEILLKKILKAIITSTAGLKYVLIIDDTGITVMSQSKFNIPDEAISVEKIGAIGGAVFTAGEEQGQILGFGTIKLQMTEYDEGMIFSVKVGAGTLCVATDIKVQIGLIRNVMKKWAPKISIVLNRYLKTDQGVINEELNELFGADSMGLL